MFQSMFRESRIFSSFLSLLKVFSSKGLVKKLLGVCFIAEDPKKNTFERFSRKQAPKLLSIKLRHKDRSQDEGSNRLKDELT
jgi:hypothetical protein